MAVTEAACGMAVKEAAYGMVVKEAVCGMAVKEAARGMAGKEAALWHSCEGGSSQHGCEESSSWCGHNSTWLADHDDLAKDSICLAGHGVVVHVEDATWQMAMQNIFLWHEDD